MEIEYNNRVTGFDFRTQSATLTIEGTCRKNTESGALTEFSARATKASEPYQPHEIRLIGGVMKYFIQGLDGSEVTELMTAVQSILTEFTAQ